MIGHRDRPRASARMKRGGPPRRLWRLLGTEARRPGGFTAIELTLGLAVLLIPTALLVLTLPTWVEIESGARAAARSAARAAVLSDDLSRVQTHAEAVASNQLGFRHGALDRLELGGALVPGGAVEARVTVTYPALDVPMVGAFGSFRHTTVHREPVDLHRSFR